MKPIRWIKRQWRQWIATEDDDNRLAVIGHHRRRMRAAMDRVRWYRLAAATTPDRKMARRHRRHMLEWQSRMAHHARELDLVLRGKTRITLDETRPVGPVPR